jgi:hypothetical protein
MNYVALRAYTEGRLDEFLSQGSRQAEFLQICGVREAGHNMLIRHGPEGMIGPESWPNTEKHSLRET